MKAKGSIITACIIFALASFLPGCSVPSNNNTDIIQEKEEPKVLTIYNGRQEKFIIPLVEKFEKDKIGRASCRERVYACV